MNFWDERYSQPDYAYGKEPSEFLLHVADTLKKGPILSLGEGEGRNATYLASRGHSVVAVDQSLVGLKKAQALALERGLTIQTVHVDLANYIIDERMWNGVVIFFCHLPRDVRTRIHSLVVKGLVPGGRLVMECFAKGQLGRGTGGPKSLDLLYDEKELREDFTGLDFEICETKVRTINQGLHHQGDAQVIQILGRKPCE